jgi:hypothetical protein
MFISALHGGWAGPEPSDGDNLITSQSNRATRTEIHSDGCQSVSSMPYKKIFQPDEEEEEEEEEGSFDSTTLPVSADLGLSGTTRVWSRRADEQRPVRQSDVLTALYSLHVRQTAQA